MDITDIGVVAAATIAGPVLAVQAQKWIERATERKRARRAIFHALMSNRATRMNDDFVKALNLIDLEFGADRRQKSDRNVINAWRSLFGEYQYGSRNDLNESDIKTWAQRVDDRLVSLLAAMASTLGYTFSEEELRRGIYYPKGRVDVENNQLAILSGLKQLLEGKLSIPMKITEIPTSTEFSEAQITLAKKSIAAYENGALNVRFVESDDKGG